ncbi:TPA: hypothetical protein ACF2DE_003348 [Clostridium perfringens]
MLNKLFLDLNNFKANLGSVERGDSIELNIKLLNDEDYSRSKFRVLGTKADGKYVEQIEGINLEEKDLKVILEDQFVNCEGIVKLELNVVSGETEITTKEFYFFVSNTMNASIIDSADSLPTLEKVSKYVDDAVDNLETLKGASEDITIINSEFKENEIKRKANEMLREKNEKSRLQSEDIRITEEEEREANELERIQAENDRKVDESNRKLAENTRVTNERAREEAELSRQSTFEENEEIRNSNENLRIASEKERIKFNNKAKTDEVNRKEAETKRVEAENTRVIAEDERKKAETSRQEAEDIRQNTYTNFNEAEEERKNNEISRQEAEALRIEAEKRRDDLYSQKEEERNATFLESERTRDTAFKEAQNDRNLTFEESERVREEAFKVSEATRNEAEEGRVAAELLREEAEKLRATGEENRNNTFTQSEEERQGVFEEAENARKVAESKRVETESARVETEKLRVSAETERVEAENLRVIAEEGRVAAETKREEGFNTFEGKINANTEELKNARSATTGEKFDTLDERIDCEVDRLNKKIDVTMLQQEDKGSHLVENTVEGMTTDMVIKGRTLQNIHPKATYKFATNYSPSNFEKNEGENSCEITLKAKEEGKYCFISAGQVYFPLLEPNTKYTIIANATDGLMPEIMTPSYTHSLTTHKVAFKNGVATFTTNDLSAGANGQVLYIPINVDLINVKQYIKNAMIIKGDLSHSLDYFEGIKSFGQQEDKISILSSGKNLWDGTFTIGSLDTITGVESNAGENRKRSNFISIEKLNTDKITITQYDAIDPIYVHVYDENKNIIGNVYTGNLNFYPINAKLSVTLPSNAKFLRFRTENNRDLKPTSTQIEEGTQSTSYQEYISNKKDILLQELGFDEGLRGLNDSIYDELNKIRNVAIKRVDKRTFTGNESWQPSSELQNEFICFYINFPSATATTPILCNNFIQKPTMEKNVECITNNGGGNSTIRIKIKKSKLATQDVEGFKKWLKENPTTIYFELTEPVETPLDESIALKVYNEKTYVNFENSIKGTSSFKAPVDTTATIARLNRENRALEEENVKLKENMIKQTIYFENEDKKMTDYTLDMDFKMCLMEMDIEDIKANLGGDINAKK